MVHDSKNDSKQIPLLICENIHTSRAFPLALKLEPRNKLCSVVIGQVVSFLSKSLNPGLVRDLSISFSQLMRRDEHCLFSHSNRPPFLHSNRV